MTYVDARQAAAILQCSTQHIRALVKRGTLTNQAKVPPLQIDPLQIAHAIESGTITPRPRARIDTTRLARHLTT